MAQEVTIDAATMARDLDRQGRVALYGIYFGFDKAELEPESMPTLREIARTLPGEAYHIWWGAYVGMAEEIICEGPLAEVSDRIIEIRAKAREAHGWIMDIYLLRREA